MNNFDNETEKPVIIIEERPEVIPGQGEGEVPVITIEEGDEPVAPVGKKSIGRKHWILLSIVLTGLVCAALWAGWRIYRMYTNLGVPVAVSSAENIEKLKAQCDLNAIPEVVKSSDTILGVPLNFYEVRGLKAEISMQQPDSTDTDVFLYSRCSDYRMNMSIIGDIVIAGEELPSAKGNRIGYFASAGDNFVIGIARDHKVKDYVKRNEGYFFRQFILLSDNELSPKYYLHGKVERRGIGRLADDRIFYIESTEKETMWSFADALREYGFVDAIYITGGDDYCYYRSADGELHDIGDKSKYPHKYPGQVPWLVFKKR